MIFTRNPNAQEIDYLTKFSETAHMRRRNGPYFVEGRGTEDDSDVIDHNNPPKGQPGTWCQWVPTADGRHIEWDGGENFYDSEAWMTYLIDHFLKNGALAPLDFLRKNHVVNGRIKASGEDRDDNWVLIVKDNTVSSKRLQFNEED